MRAGGEPADVVLGGGLEQLRDTIDVVLAQGEAEPDAARRLKRITAAVGLLEGYGERLGAARLDAVAELREAGWSYQRIALRTGLSKSRIAQLARAAARPGDDRVG